MEDYPRTLVEFEKRFSTDEACRRYLFALRWPSGFCCPRCNGTKAWPMNRGLFLCGRCRYQASVTAGTIFQDTRLPLVMWFRAMWYITNEKNGASALSVQRVLGLRSYQTAWTWMHKLRRAMVRPGRDRLNGRIEVDEAYWGSFEEGRHGRKTTRKVLIVVAAQEDGPRIGRIRLRRIMNASAESLHPFIEQAVEPNSVVRTDGWPGYVGIGKKGFLHEVCIIRKQQASELLPRVHMVISLLKRWLLGTHQGAVSHAHLDYYLDEFTFRFNRRTSRSRGKLFFRLVQQSLLIAPTTYSSIIKPQLMGSG